MEEASDELSSLCFTLRRQVRLREQRPGEREELLLLLRAP
jgi:hypothetical protein